MLTRTGTGCRQKDGRRNVVQHEARVVISLFDESAVMLAPWREAGFECWAVDAAHPPGVTVTDDFHLVGHDLAVPWMPPFGRDRIAFVSAFPPCNHLAVSGARWFQGLSLIHI